MFLRSIKKLNINNSVRGIFTRWKIQAKDYDETIPILFGDGLISINSQAKMNIGEYQAENYATLVSDGFDLVKKYSLKDGNVFLGRDENYLLMRGGDLDIKTKDLNIETNDISIEANNLDLNCQDINITCQDLILTATSLNITCPSITINGIVFAFTGGKLSINGKEVAVIGGDIDPVITNKIITSGQ